MVVLAETAEVLSNRYIVQVLHFAWRRSRCSASQPGPPAQCLASAWLWPELRGFLVDVPSLLGFPRDVCCELGFGQPQH